MYQNTDEFVDDHNRVVAYDGSPVQWRISVQAWIERDSQVLLIKDRRQTFLSTPGGGVEVGESLEEALQREMLEEVGTPVKRGELLYVHQDKFYHRGNGRFYCSLLFFFQAELLGELGQPQDTNIEYAQWYALSQLRVEQLNAVVAEVWRWRQKLPASKQSVVSRAFAVPGESA